MLKRNVGIWLVILTAVVHLLMAPVDAQRTTTVTRTTTSTVTNVVTSLSNVSLIQFKKLKLIIILKKKNFEK